MPVTLVSRPMRASSHSAAMYPMYADKQVAERVVLRVFGVKAVANDLAVHLPSAYERTDTEIAQAAVTALTWNTIVPAGRVTVAVANGWLTLNGTLNGNTRRTLLPER